MYSTFEKYQNFQIFRENAVAMKLIFSTLFVFFNYKCTADSNRAGGYYFMRTKHIIGDFEGFFEWAKTFFTPKLSCGRF